VQIANSSVRRLGFLLDWTGHERQARALEPFLKNAKTGTPLNLAAKPLVASLAETSEKNSKRETSHQGAGGNRLLITRTCP
jgi:hypothetical protein